MKLFKRENYLYKIRGFYDACDIIKVITGIRRCGKSTIMQIIAEELRESGVNEENICFINLDKRGYRKIKTSNQLEELIDYSINAKGIKYLFIDEIQNVKGFEEVINGYREDGEYSIFISGSNSYMLSGELITKLTGRYLEFEIYTLTFEEYVKMKEFYGMPVDNNLLIELNKYIIEGGFPRTLFFENLSDKRTYATETVKEILEKDVYKRIKIRNRDSFELVTKYLINNFGLAVSFNNIVEGLKKGGNEIKNYTISKYVKALINAKILYECDRFDLNSNKSLKGEKKYYLSDLSFAFLTNPNSKINYGPVLENIIYIYSKSKGYIVSVGKIGKLECDFILKDNDLNYSYVQVAYTILASEETEEREYRSLEHIKDNYPKYIVTTDYLLQKRNGIKHVNIMEFLTKGNKF